MLTYLLVVPSGLQMSVGLQDPGSDGQIRPRHAEEDREDPQPPGPVQGQTPLCRPGLQTDLRLPEGETHSGFRLVWFWLAL